MWRWGLEVGGFKGWWCHRMGGITMPGWPLRGQYGEEWV